MNPLHAPALQSITEFTRGASFPVIGVSNAGSIQSANAEIESLLGINRKSLLKKSIYELISPASGKNLKKILAQTVNIQTFSGTVDLLAKGKTLTATFFLFPVYVDLKSPSYFVLSFNNPEKEAKTQEEIDAANHIADLNLRKLHNVNERLIAAHKAEEEAIRVKENFLTNVSHEIRTPLNGIIGITKLLSDSRLDGKQKEFVAAISISSEQLLNIINDLLDFSKINSSNFEFDNDEFDLGKSLNAIIPVFRIIADSKKLNFNVGIDRNIPALLVGDQYRLNQIINNLLTNAFKFTAKGQVKLDCDLIGIENNIALIRFTIADTGIGISKQNIGKIFDTFTQASNSTNNKYGGTGLGLSISKQLIERMGGAISVSSRLNEGTTFTVTLTMPVAESGKTKPLSTGDNNNDLINPVKILAVDDNEINRFYIENVFNDKNISVKTLENGKDCLALLKKESFDIILMDLQMPGMDGYKTTHKIRNSLKLATPVIALTAASAAQEEKKCLAAGMNSVIQKPFTKESILQAISKYTTPAKPAKKNQKLSVKKNRIDFTKLRSITGNNEQKFGELLDISLKNIDRDIKKLGEAIGNKSFTDIRALTHKLKSTFGLYELNDIYELLDKIEASSEKKASFKKIEKDFEQLKQPVNLVMEELQQLKQ